ncbi:MAG: hypothetical protein A2Y40_05330 [Candidatus Margulisbacteria bacterium GWF2_35_9]|nr:MAG: hypothetical protein A2Y40_05330 [Candidatus Margulisbacteria bacterium GWF2_35_9]
MRILLIPSAYFPSLGGVEEVVRQLVRVYQKKDIAVQIVTSRSVNTKRREVWNGLTINRFHFYLPARRVFNLIRFFIYFPLEVFRLLLIVRFFKPTVINVHCASGNLFYATIVSKICKIPLVLSSHGETVMDAHKIYQTSAFMKRSLITGLNHASFVTACSKATLDELIQNYLDVSAKSTFIHNGIDQNEFKQIKEPIADRYIFATGRLSYNKGFDLLIHSFSKTIEQLSDIKLLIGGSGEELENLNQLIKENCLMDRVVLLGRLNREEVVRYMQSSMFVVMPSRYEPFGIVALEAMAAGKAILATNQGGTTEFIHDGEQGLLVNPNHPEELSLGITKMLNEYKMLEQGNKEYSEQFNWNKIAGTYIDIYNCFKFN